MELLEVAVYQVCTDDDTIAVAFDSGFDVEDRVLDSLHRLRHAIDRSHDKKGSRGYNEA